MDNADIQAALQIRDILYRDTKTGVSHDGVSAVAAIAAMVITCLIFYAQNESAQLSIATSIDTAQSQVHAKNSQLVEADKKQKVADKIDFHTSRILVIQKFILITIGLFVTVFVLQFSYIRKDKALDEHSLVRCGRKNKNARSGAATDL
jgi:hypothetical protein